MPRERNIKPALFLNEDLVECSFPTPTIDPEFKDLFPPLSSDERSLLEESIRRDGCQQPIVLWNGIVIDGHNRLEICTKNSLPYSTVEMDFPDRLAVQIWILMNQLGRRNLRKTARMDLALRLKSQLQTEAQVRMRAGKKSDPVETLPQGTGRTRDRAAALADVSGKTLDKYQEVLKKGAPELVAATRAGKVSINAAAKAVKTLSPAEQLEVATALNPAQDVKAKLQSERRAEMCATWTKQPGGKEWIGCAGYAPDTKVKFTKKGSSKSAVYTVQYDHFDQKDEAPSVFEAKYLGELYLAWRDEAARSCG